MKIPKENTYPYLATGILPLLFLYLLLGEKKPFPPLPPFNIGICTGDWLIEFLLNIFCIVFACGYTDAYLPSSVSCTNAIPYVYHIFYKERITFLDPPGGRVWVKKCFSPWLRFRSAIHWAPFPGFEWRNGFLPCRFSPVDYF